MGLHIQANLLGVGGGVGGTCKSCFQIDILVILLYFQVISVFYGSYRR